MENKHTREEIKSVVNEVMQKFDESIRLYISGNTKLINDKLDKIELNLENFGKKLGELENRVKINEKSLEEFRDSIEFTQNLLDTKIENFTNDLESKLATKIQNINGVLYAAKKQDDYLKDKIRILEDRNRRSNLRIDGVQESDQETWSQCEEKIKRIMKENMEIDTEIEIERAHRMGNRQNSDGRPRTIIFKLFNWKQKELILKNRKNLKGTGYYVNEDFSDETMDIRRNLYKEMKKQRDLGKYSVVVYDKLITRDFRGEQPFKV